MKKKDIDALLDIVQFYLDYCTVQEGYIARYARELYEDLWEKLHGKPKKD